MRLLIAAVLVVTTSARADTIRCAFTRGISNTPDAAWSGGHFVTKDWDSPKSLGGWFDLKPETLHFVIKYTPGQQHATLSGNNDSGDVSMIESGSHRSFVEVAPGGGVNTLTVATERNAHGVYLAAYSRHSILLSTLIVSQYWGSCQ